MALRTFNLAGLIKEAATGQFIIIGGFLLACIDMLVVRTNLPLVSVIEPFLYQTFFLS